MPGHDNGITPNVNGLPRVSPAHAEIYRAMSTMLPPPCFSKLRKVTRGVRVMRNDYPASRLSELYATSLWCCSRSHCECPAHEVHPRAVDSKAKRFVAVRLHAIDGALRDAPIHIETCSHIGSLPAGATSSIESIASALTIIKAPITACSGDFCSPRGQSRPDDPVGATKIGDGIGDPTIRYAVLAG